MDVVKTLFDTDKFISAIEARPSLWDTSAEEYSNKTIKQAHWVEVAKNMNNDFEQMPSASQNDYGKDLQKKWKSLRNSFARELAKRKQKKSGSGATWKTYIYFEQLSFLTRSATDKETTASMPPDPESNSENEYDKIDDSASSSGQPPKRKQNKYDKNRDQANEVLEVIKRSIQEREHTERRLDEDEDRQFLLSLLGDLRRLNPGKKMEVKLEMMQALRKASMSAPLPPIIFRNPPAPQSLAMPPAPYLYPSNATSMFHQPDLSACSPHMHPTSSFSHFQQPMDYHQQKNDSFYTQPQSNLQDVPISMPSPAISPGLLSPASSSCNSQASEVIDLLSSYDK